MKRIYLLLFWGSIIGIIHTSCERSDENGLSDKDSAVVSQFVYDGLSTYYFWADDMTRKKPTSNDTDPRAYFKKVLHSTDSEHGWSWITDDVNALLAGFSGTDLSFGYDLEFIEDKEGNNTAYAFIKYVYSNTPAAKAGLKRLDLIKELNGQPIKTERRDGDTYVASSAINLLYGNNTVTFNIYKFSEDQIVHDKEITITPDKSAKNPVLYDNVYEIGDKKIGYLFYTDFYDNYNNHLFEVFQNFKQQGITDLVLDLRYNTGGAASAALYLASLIAPESAVKANSPFVMMNYNKLLNSSFDKWYNEAKPADKYKYDRKQYLGEYDQRVEANPMEANLDLDKVYIIATNGSYSASELITFCLKSYMDVVHIGSKTGGKYTASWTIHGYDDDLGVPVYDSQKLSSKNKEVLKNWAMQPIVAQYANWEGESFSNPGYLAPDYPLEEGFGKLIQWTPIGDPKDVLLGQALYLISGDPDYQPKEIRSISITRLISRKVANPIDMSKPVVIEHNLTTEDFLELRELQN